VDKARPGRTPNTDQVSGVARAAEQAGHVEVDGRLVRASVPASR
jgi:hypothetical protein